MSKELEFVKMLLDVGNSEKHLLNLSNTNIMVELIKTEKALIQAEKDKIIADFIRNHYVISNDVNNNYLVLKKPISEEESNKFKEMLK